MLDEKKLIKLALARDLTAMQLLYESCFDSIFRYLRHKTSSREMSEDLASEAFTKAFENLSKFRGESSFKSWVYTIAHNLLVDYYKSKGAVLPLDEYQASDNETEESDTISEIELRNEREVQDILIKLKPRYREVLELRFLSNFSVRETAEALGISENNVKIIQNRALKQARKLSMNDHGD